MLKYCKYCGALLDDDDTDYICSDCRDDGATPTSPPKTRCKKTERLPYPDVRPDGWPKFCEECGYEFKPTDVGGVRVCMNCDIVWGL